jgi:hypothetical protein
LRPGRPSFNAVLNAYDLVRSTSRVRVKIGSVIQPGNADVVHRVIDLFRHRPAPDTWKIYEVSYSNYANDNRAFLEMGPAEIDGAVQRCLLRASEMSVSVAVHRNDTRDGAHLFVEPDGSIMAVESGDERVVAPSIVDLDRAVEVAQTYVDFPRVAANFHKTYPSSPIRDH